MMAIIIIKKKFKDEVYSQTYWGQEGEAKKLTFLKKFLSARHFLTLLFFFSTHVLSVSIFIHVHINRGQDSDTCS